MEWAQASADADNGALHMRRHTAGEKVVALAGNPNVGKSTVFNGLTGLHQHTGNWPGKTVAVARGVCRRGEGRYLLVDVPGTYSLMANSAEEEVARDFLCFGGADAVIVVADATCLERNLNLTLQVLEVTNRVVLCVNLMDEAEKKGIRVDLDRLSARLGIPVVGASARSGKGLEALMDAVESTAARVEPDKPSPVVYDADIEAAVALLEPAAAAALDGRFPSRWAALRLLEGDAGLLRALDAALGFRLEEHPAAAPALAEARLYLERAGLSPDRLRDRLVTCLLGGCEALCREVVTLERAEYAARDHKIDRILTHRLAGMPLMLALLALVFWLTIVGSNLPSDLLSAGLFSLEAPLHALFSALSAPDWLRGALLDGVYRTLAWVISVMLPPMAIFFPLFTLLEDLGYLPRVAFNLDDFFRRARAHGKQSLTMCMGFGCNACGVVGCRIIDSPRERLIAILTNSFVPCNGRFPTLIALIAMFFAGTAGTALASLRSALLLTGTIALSVMMTLVISSLLSRTVLRGMPSSFHLELPPYRRPQLGAVIVRSVLDRTVFVLGRAAAVAAPAGLVIWLLANLRLGDASLLAQCAAFLDPFARLMGLDGYILMAFILGFPANEIVMPILIMSYLSAGALTEPGSLAELRTLLVDNGWTWLTAVCATLFTLMHWPCATTCLTVRAETQSLRWTLLAAALPTGVGILLCVLTASAARLLGLA